MKHPPDRIYRELYKSLKDQLKKEERKFVAKARVLIARFRASQRKSSNRYDLPAYIRCRERLRHDEGNFYYTLIHKAKNIEEFTNETSPVEHGQQKTNPIKLLCMPRSPKRHYCSTSQRRRRRKCAHIVLKEGAAKILIVRSCLVLIVFLRHVHLSFPCRDQCPAVH